ncbi:MAG: hypothetical protein AAGA03_01405 [Planctomycetota bacterium]
MKTLRHSLLCLVALVIYVGCKPAETPPTASVSDASTDHDHDHSDHDHDHDDHAHDHDDHEGHDHDDHDHDGHDHGDADAAQAKYLVLSYKEALEKLKTMNDEIAKIATGEAVDDSHGPLHEVGHLLLALYKIAEKDGIVDEGLDIIDEESDALFTLFDKVDSKLHDKKGKDYEEVSDAIKASISNLEAVR